MNRLVLCLAPALTVGRLAALYVAFVCLAGHGVAAAQHSSARAAEPPGYRALVAEAVAEYDSGNFAEARSLFDKANSLHSTARALRGLGMVEFELRNYGDSIAFLERALESDVQPLAGPLRDETERLLARARAFVGQFDLSVEPNAATINVDGMPMQLGPRGRLALPVGDHELEASASGYRTEKQVLKVKGGEQHVLHIALQEERPAPAPLQLQVQPEAVSTSAVSTRVDSGEPVRKPLYKNPWLWTGVGVVVVALAVGLGVGLSARGPGHADPVGFDKNSVVIPAH